MLRPATALASESLTLIPQGGYFRLKKLFSFLNVKCFHGQIPANVEVFWSEIIGVSLSKCNVDKGQRKSGQIYISKAVFRNQDRDLIINVLLHEMIHEYIANFPPPTPDKEIHGVEFQKLMAEINGKFHTEVRIVFNQPAYQRAAERVLVHRWKCNTCGYTYKRSVKLKVIRPKIVEAHTASGCKGVLLKLTHSDAKADIETSCNGFISDNVEAGTLHPHNI